MIAPDVLEHLKDSQYVIFVFSFIQAEPYYQTENRQGEETGLSFSLVGQGPINGCSTSGEEILDGLSVLV